MLTGEDEQKTWWEAAVATYVINAKLRGRESPLLRRYEWYFLRDEKYMMRSRHFLRDDFKVKRNQQTPRNVKLHALQSGCPGFSKFSVFDHQNQNIDFLKKINAQKSNI